MFVSIDVDEVQRPAIKYLTTLELSKYERNNYSSIIATNQSTTVITTFVAIMLIVVAY